jgi:mRNA-degrading endonuclease RelE of RelBE toxin-antitoxin system
VAARKRGGRQRPAAYRIEYDTEAVGDLRDLAAPARARVVDAIEMQLPHEPTVETRNRFRAEPNSLGDYELRVQPYRVYFDVDDESRRVVVQAVLYKPRETAYRRGKEIDTHDRA